MKIFKTAMTATFGMLGLVASANAATVIWTTPVNATTSADVVTTNSLLYAYDFGSGSDLLVNGVTFSAFGATGTSPTVGNVTLATGGTPTMESFTGYSTNATGTNYASLLDTGSYVNNSGGGSELTFTMTLAGLTSGDSYFIQIWAADGRGLNGTARTETITGGANTSASLIVKAAGTNPYAGQFVTGTFTADAATQLLTFTADINAQVNALQVRAVPEPTTVAMLAFGLTTVMALRRRR